MDCLPADRLLELADGISLGAQQALALQHLDECAACREKLARAEAERSQRRPGGSAPANTPAETETQPSLFRDGLDEAPTLIRAHAASPGALDNGPHAPAPGDKVGRYLLLGQLGAGGMGVVFRAYDPSLDRVVAIKLLGLATRSAAETEALRARLKREAQAMARLSHANIVHVHDLGQEGDHVYIAMELIEGQTLRAWQREKPRGWREIAAMYREAGLGLAAAHAAGLVHRDFKPDNVLVGADGRARVTDFGLARLNLEVALAERAQPTPHEAAMQAAAPESPLALVTTQAGVVMGTPLYMAPEQLRGGPAGAAADQFAFCVSLWEAIAGEPPFRAQSARARLERIERAEAGTVELGRMPLWFKRTLRQGMNADPAARHASMEKLLARLARDPWRRALGPALLAAALVAVPLLGARVAAWRAEQTCRGAEAKLAGVWDAQLREQTRRAFAATNLPGAEAAWSAAAAPLDRYAADWIAMRTEACEATAVRHQQPADLLDLRIACLDERLHGLSAVSRLFARADADTVTHASAVAGGLGSLSGCADANALRAPTAPTLTQKPQVDALKQREAEMQATGNAGHVKEAIAQTQALLVDARKLGYAPLVASLVWDLGYYEYHAEDFDSARRTLAEAAALSFSSHNERVCAEAWMMLAHIDLSTARLDDALVHIQQAQAAVARLGDDLELRVLLGRLLSIQASLAGRAQDGLRLGEEDVALAEKLPANSEFLGLALENLGQMQINTAHNAQARRTFERELPLVVARHGADSALAATAELNLANAEIALRRNASARAHLTHAISVMEKNSPRGNGQIVGAYQSLGYTDLVGDPARALTSFEHAVQVARQLGNETDELPSAMRDAATALQALGRLDDARREFEDAYALALKHNPAADNPELRDISNGLADVLSDLGKKKDAHRVLEPARLALEQAPPGTQLGPADGYTLFELGRAAAAEGRRADAERLIARSLPLMHDGDADTPESITYELTLAELERAERLFALPPPEAGVDDRVDRDRTQFLLAQARLAAKRHPSREEVQAARRLAEQARDRYAARGARYKTEHDAVVKWLAAHPERA